LDQSNSYGPVAETLEHADNNSNFLKSGNILANRAPVRFSTGRSQRQLFSSWADCSGSHISLYLQLVMSQSILYSKPPTHLNPQCPAQFTVHASSAPNSPEK
jgi:hypothetical protein